MTKANVRHVVHAAIALIMILGPTASAGVEVPDGGQLDIVFIFRAVLAALLGVLIWIAKGTDVRLHTIERRIGELNDISIRRHTTIEHNIQRIQMLEHEQKQLASLISMQREMLLTKYLDKEETERHRARVEETLARQNEVLTTICHRLDTMARPLHRATDEHPHG